MYMQTHAIYIYVHFMNILSHQIMQLATYFIQLNHVKAVLSTKHFRNPS